jgi:hypothetical protein
MPGRRCSPRRFRDPRQGHASKTSRASGLVLEERETKAAKSRIDGPDMGRLFQVIR